MSVKCTDCGADIPDREQMEYNKCRMCRNKSIRLPNGKTLIPADMPNPILPKKPEDEDRFETAVLCPVCGVEIDRITHPKEELHSMVAPLVCGSRRRKHGEENPACAKHPNWIHGWTLKPIKRPEADPPKPEPTCAKCGKNIQQHPSEQIHRDTAGRPICYLCVLANAQDGEFIPAPTCLKCGRPMMRSRNDPVNGMLWYCDRCYNAQTRPTNPTGWECPRCKGIHAPSVLRCDCKSDYNPICPVCNKSHPPRSPGGFPTCYPIQL